MSFRKQIERAISRLPAEQRKISRYREHNVTEARGEQPDGSFARKEFGTGTGVTGVTPNPHEGRCQCEDCREITRRYSRTVANEQGER